MGKTIAVRHNLSFVGLINYIYDKDIRGTRFKSNDAHEVLVSFDGEIEFVGRNFNNDETYEVEIYHEVTMECKYAVLVELLVYNRLPNVYLDTSMNDIIGDDTKEIHALINDQFYKILDVFDE